MHAAAERIRMRILILYSVVGTVLWAVAAALGAGFGVSMLVALAGPPVGHIAYIVLKDR